MEPQTPQQQSRPQPRLDTSDRRYFFIHCLKTAGTTLSLYLRKIFASHELFPADRDHGNIDAVMTMEFLEERMLAEGSDIRMVMGHFPYCTTEFLSKDFETITVLREPVERTLSYLRHHRLNEPRDKDKSLEEIYDDPFRFHGAIHNHMVKMFSLDISDKKTGMYTKVDFTRDHLEQAKQTLERVSVIGVQENYTAFCTELGDQYGWSVPGKYRANRTDSSEVVSEAFRRRIAEDNSLDNEFYQFALDVIKQRGSSG